MVIRLYSAGEAFPPASIRFAQEVIRGPAAVKVSSILGVLLKPVRQSLDVQGSGCNPQGDRLHIGLGGC